MNERTHHPDIDRGLDEDAERNMAPTIATIWGFVALIAIIVASLGAWALKGFLG